MFDNLFSGAVITATPKGSLCCSREVEMTKNRYVGINCSVCGRWVGKDGFLDIGVDSDGVPDCGYPLCKRCLDGRSK